MFELANNYSSYHLIPQSSDLALSPPESYFFVTDFLIISCGVLYTLCYLFYMTRTYSDRFLAGSVLFLSQTMAYELYYAKEERGRTVWRLMWMTVLGIVFLWGVGQVWPDEREQLTAFWTGVYLELPIGWGQVYYLLKRGDTKGQSLEIWITRYLGCICAFLVFIWRYLNAPDNWSYVGSFWSVAGMVVTLLPETVYPFVYVWAHKKERGNEKTKAE
ncbi:hypothetical protein N0V95_001736 [Ascochyta clinopodiicola]|nr:hypothetical protein N0V95_001736 [Ascochyta clinopodiicola]